MPESDQNHSGIAVPVAVIAHGLDQIDGARPWRPEGGHFRDLAAIYYYLVTFEIFSRFGSAIQNFSTPSRPPRFLPSWRRGASSPRLKITTSEHAHA